MRCRVSSRRRTQQRRCTHVQTSVRPTAHAVVASRKLLESRGVGDDEAAGALRSARE